MCIGSEGQRAEGQMTIIREWYIEIEDFKKRFGSESKKN